MPAPYTPGPQSSIATIFGTAMGVMAAEVVAMLPAVMPPAMLQIAFGNVLVDCFAPRTFGSSDPVAPGVVGQLHVNTASGNSFIYNGSAWKKLKYDP